METKECVSSIGYTQNSAEAKWVGLFRTDVIMIYMHNSLKGLMPPDKVQYINVCIDS